MPVLTRSNRPEELFKGSNGTTIKPTLHQSRTRFLPVEFDRNGKLYAKPDPDRPAHIQDYYKLRTECLRNRTLFEDPEFLADDSSLYIPDDLSSPSPYKWLRPHEISPEAVFVSDGFSRFDIQQGELGDCWLLAAAANLTIFPVLFNRVVPEDNDAIKGGRKGVDYAGIFHFRFWRFGQWYDVVVDDRLPTYRGKLVYIKSSTQNEFWSALLEKAYAKLFGSYQALIGGSASEAMEDFTGGLTEAYDMKEVPKNLFEMIGKGCQSYAMFSCSIPAPPREMEITTAQGLVKGHAYSITKAQAVDIETPRVKGKIQLLRLRNPWGNHNEWNGAWSDKSAEWRYISEESKTALGLTFEVDGEFWMSYPDFLKYFERVEMCHLSPDCPIAQQQGRFAWKQSSFEGEWVRGSTAGGCRNFPDTFWHNPQYIVNLEDPDEDDDEQQCTMIVSLIQKNRRSKRNKGIECLTIGFAVYRVELTDLKQKPLPKSFFINQLSAAKSTFINMREVTCRFRFNPGMYVIVPSTYDPNEEGEFMIRVFSETASNMKENDSTIGVGDLESSVTDAQRMTMERLFVEVAGEDGEVDWMELKLVLDRCFREDLTNSGFSKDACRSMVAMLDDDGSGKLGLIEFQKLLTDIARWKAVFKQYDTNQSGHLNPFELRSALQSAGYTLNNHIVNMLMHRYGSKEAEIWFDDFITCAVKIRTMFDIFRARDVFKRNEAKFTLEEWIVKTIYS
ncbi:calpain-A-like [Anopheles ziemanni]|uniref:calpain-A-like n=1 Tax=Anopheles coustani TaxID=139045 RepID=UPI0026594F6E|nr:calpain-A-like [Anopheles coustani]XP_058170909.1 calpain-A-like [Anopheles ziemanni]